MYADHYQRGGYATIIFASEKRVAHAVGTVAGRIPILSFGRDTLFP